MGFQIGQIVGGYEFIRMVDSSDATLVYEVFNEAESRRELLKLLPRELQEDRKRVERFLREAKIHAHMTHSSIAAFYAAMELDGQLVMTTELIEGVTLESRLAEGPLELTRAVDIAIEALAALQYAHEQRVVHREIIPANLYLTPDGSIKLAGFELARQFADPKLTQPGTVVGSVHYMSPEQVKGLSEVDGRSDVYSLGVVLYEMTTGVRPFESRSQFDIIQSHVLKAPAPPTDRRPGIPEALSLAILRALGKTPEQRYPSAEDFAAELASVRPLVKAAERASGAGTATDTALTLDTRSQEPEPEPGPAPRVDRPAREARAGRTPPRRRDIAPAAGVPGAAAAASQALEMGSSHGWRTRDLVVVGSLTFVMVMSLVLALLVIFDR